MSHGFSKSYLNKLPKFNQPYWKYDHNGKSKPRVQSKHWSQFEYYKSNPDAALRRKLWESGERDFCVLAEKLGV